MKKHIVIIEDNPDILKLMDLLISEAGYRVTALSSLNSFEELSELQADCFILDEQLPYINGHIICIILKSKPQTRHIPVILVSGHEAINEFATLCEADGYLQKPFDDIQQLARLVGECLSFNARHQLK